MRPLKVLILQDNPFQLTVLHQMLNAFRIFDVLTAQSVASARQSLVRRGAIDVAICELFREELPGLELIRELAIKQEAQALIMLSCAPSHVIETAMSLAREEGLKVLGCLPNPVTPQGLELLLASYQTPSFRSCGDISYDMAT